jgi:hypothetical protein
MVAYMKLIPKPYLAPIKRKKNHQLREADDPPYFKYCLHEGVFREYYYPGINIPLHKAHSNPARPLHSYLQPKSPLIILITGTK